MLASLISEGVRTARGRDLALPAREDQGGWVFRVADNLICRDSQEALLRRGNLGDHMDTNKNVQRLDDIAEQLSAMHRNLMLMARTAVQGEATREIGYDIKDDQGIRINLDMCADELRRISSEMK